MDFVVVDGHVVPPEGEPSTSKCTAQLPQLVGRGGLNAQFTEGVVYLPVVYQANTYHLHMVTTRAAAAVDPELQGSVLAVAFAVGVPHSDVCPCASVPLWFVVPVRLCVCRVCRAVCAVCAVCAYVVL